MMLVIAGMITRLLGFVNRIVVARLMGEEGVGLYMMALPTLFLMITLTQIGLPIAISKRVAEANAKQDIRKIKRIITLSFFIITCTSFILTIAMVFLAPIVANYLLTDVRTLYPLLAVSPSVPIIAFSSVMKGYFQGMQNMKPQSIAIVIEQTVRIIAVYFVITALIPYGVEFAAAGAMICVLIGELASFFYLFIVFKQKKIIRIRRNFFTFLKGSHSVRRELFSIAIPNTGSRLISSFSSFLEPIFVAQSLKIAGVSTIQATKQYGELTGYAMPLLFLPTFITNSLSIALIPSIAEAEAQGKNHFVHYRIHQAIRISFASGALATIIFTIFSIPILTYMYDTSNASRYITFLAPFFIFLYVQAPLQAALFALDLAKYAMWNSFFGSVVKFIVLFFLASNEDIGIMGVVIAISTSIVLITFLHLSVLYKQINFSLRVVDVIKMILLLGITYGVGKILQALFLSLFDELLAFIFVIFILIIVYILLIILLNFITKEELKHIPILKNLIK